jgi:predicted GNAT family N-acyltransferase
MGTIIIRKVESGKELDIIFEIRQKVFVDEQKVDPVLEYDEFEETSIHFIALYDGTAVGTARWRHTPNGIKLERFAVLPQYRNKGIGGRLVESTLNDLPTMQNVYLHAQVQACSLYARYGFKEEGDEFIEADLRHYKMVLIPK